MEVVGIDHLYYFYILVGTVLGLIALSVAAKKAYRALKDGVKLEINSQIKEEYMTIERAEKDFREKSDIEHDCFALRADCTKKICAEIKDVKKNQELLGRDVGTVKDQVQQNLADVKGKINGVGQEVKDLRASMETELRVIARFMGSVDTFMRKNNKGASI